MRKTKNKKLNGFLVLFCVVSLIFTLFFTFTYLTQISKKETGGQNPNSDETKKIIRFLSKNPTYLPGWVALSLREMEKGNKNSAIYAFKKAKEINPNDKDVNKMEEIIKTEAAAKSNNP